MSPFSERGEYFGEGMGGTEKESMTLEKMLQDAPGQNEKKVAEIEQKAEKPEIPFTYHYASLPGDVRKGIEKMAEEGFEVVAAYNTGDIIFRKRIEDFKYN